MTTQCVVRAAERPSAAARELAPAVWFSSNRKSVWDVGDAIPYTDTVAIYWVVVGRDDRGGSE